jgi:predicted nucleic acid-binding protein
LYLVDTNIWLERLLGQDKSEIVGKFLDYVSTDQLFITDFALHSIGVILGRIKRRDVFLRFIDDLFINGSVSVVRLEVEDMQKVVSVMEEFNLDFDDAYQYIAAQKYDFPIISFDKDFDRTQLGKKIPQDIYQESEEEGVGEKDEEDEAAREVDDETVSGSV